MSRSTCNTSILVAFVVLFLSGCASMQGVVPPEITLVNLRFGEITFLESTMTMVVRLSNENPEPMVVDGGVFELYLDGERMGKGSSGERFEIPRLGSAVHEFDMHINHLAAITRVRKIMESKSFDYALRGKLYVLRGSGTKTVKVAQQGDLDLQRDFQRQAPTENTAPRS